MEEKQVLVDNLKINYKVAGQGPAILILHGWGGSSDSWVRVQELLAAAGFLVVVPDLPGFGKSVDPLNPWTVDDYVNFVLSFIKKLGWRDKFFLVGHSFGGRVSIKLASQYPGKIKKLVLCGAAGIKPEATLKGKLFAKLAKLGNIVFKFKCLARVKEIIANLFYTLIGSKDYYQAKGVMKETIKKVLAEDLVELLPEIKAETLIVWGERDNMVPLTDAFIFEDKIKLSKLEVLPKIGHSPHLEVPEELTEKILEFL